MFNLNAKLKLSSKCSPIATETISCQLLNTMKYIISDRGVRSGHVRLLTFLTRLRLGLFVCSSRLVRIVSPTLFISLSQVFQLIPIKRGKKRSLWWPILPFTSPSYTLPWLRISQSSRPETEAKPLLSSSPPRLPRKKRRYPNGSFLGQAAVAHDKSCLLHAA